MTEDDVTYLTLVEVLAFDLAEDVAIAQRLRERLAEDDGQRVELVDLAAELGVDHDGR